VVCSQVAVGDRSPVAASARNRRNSHSRPSRRHPRSRQPWSSPLASANASLRPCVTDQPSAARSRRRVGRRRTSTSRTAPVGVRGPAGHLVPQPPDVAALRGDLLRPARLAAGGVPRSGRASCSVVPSAALRGDQGTCPPALTHGSGSSGEPAERERSPRRRTPTSSAAMDPPPSPRPGTNQWTVRLSFASGSSLPLPAARLDADVERVTDPSAGRQLWWRASCASWAAPASRAIAAVHLWRDAGQVGRPPAVFWMPPRLA